jgi:hypothetical protein
MRGRSVLFVSLIVAGLSSIGCAGVGGARPAPTAPSNEQQADAGGNVARPPQPPGPEPPPSTGTCVAEKAQWAVGQPASRSLLERARVDSTASIARFLRPNEAVTLEHSPARLNLYLDERDVVRGVVCG